MSSPQARKNEQSIQTRCHPHSPSFTIFQEVPRTGSKRRNRTSLACTECRYRKVRCDGTKPVCGSCRTRGRQYTCSYNLSPNKEKKRDIFGYIDRLEKNLRQLEKAAETPAVDTNPNTETITDAGPYFVESNLNNTWETRSTLIDVETHPSPNDGPSKPQRNPELLDRGPAERLHARTFFGAPSTTHFMSQLQAASSGSEFPLPDPNEEQSPSSVYGYFPASSHDQSQKQLSSYRCDQQFYLPQSTLCQLWDTYFESVHIFYPILDESAWTWQNGCESRIETSISSERCVDSDACITNLVLALAALFTQSLNAGEALRISAQFFLKAKFFLSLDVIETPTLEKVQVLLLMTQYYIERCFHQRGHLHASLIYLSLATQTCRALGYDGKHNSDPSRSHHALTKRLWCLCVHFDITLMTHFGTSAVINVHNCDQLLPLEIEDGMAPAVGIENSSYETAMVYPFLRSSLQLSQIQSNIVARLYATSDQSTESPIYRTNSIDGSENKIHEQALQAWYDTLPSNLKVVEPQLLDLNAEPHDIFGRQRTILYIRYLYTLMLLYRRSLLRLLQHTRDQGFERDNLSPPFLAASQSKMLQKDASMSISVAIEFSRVTVSIIESAQKPISQFRSFTFYFYYVLTAASTLIAAKCAAISDRNEGACNEAWSRVARVLKHYSVNMEQHELPLKFLHKISNQIFNIAEDTENVPQASALPSPPPQASSISPEFPLEATWETLLSQWIEQPMGDQLDFLTQCYT